MTSTLYRNELEQLLIPVWRDGGEPTLSVGDGWLPLINDLVNQLLEIDPDIKILQVKEKFGGLRFYATTTSAACMELIRTAEAKAEFTCEECGNPGRTGNRGSWASVRCDDCRPDGWTPWNPKDEED